MASIEELIEWLPSSNRESLNVIDLLKPKNSSFNWILWKAYYVLCSLLRICLFPRRGAYSPKIPTQDLNTCNPKSISNSRKHTARMTSLSHEECCLCREKTFVELLWDLLQCHTDCHRSWQMPLDVVEKFLRLIYAEWCNDILYPNCAQAHFTLHWPLTQNVFICSYTI